MTKMTSFRPVAVFLVLGLVVTAVTLAANGPATQTTRPTPPSAEQVLKGVLESGPQQEPLLPVEPGQPRQAVPADKPLNPIAAEQEQQGLLPDGWPLKKTGRLVYDGTWWTLVPEGTGQSAEPERPIRLLPSSWLEKMEAASVGGTRSMLFSVTGQVTQYRGTNYLLVLNAMVRREQGNLSK